MTSFKSIKISIFLNDIESYIKSLKEYFKNILCIN